MKLNKIILLFVFFLLIIPFASAKSSVFNNYLFSGDSLTVNEENFVFSFSRDRAEILVKRDNGLPLFIEEGSCDKTNVTEICYIGYEFDYKEEKYKMKLQVFALAARITEQRSISDKTLTVGEEYTITTKLENEGDYYTKVNYEDIFPDYIILDDCDGCIIAGNKVIYSENLEEGADDEFSYTIRPLQEFQRTFTSKVNYFDGIKLQEKYLGKLSLQTLETIEIETEFNRRSEVSTSIEEIKSARLLDKVNLDITLNNLHSEADLIIDEFTVYPSDNAILDPQSTFNIETPYYKLDLQRKDYSIDAGSSKTFKFDMTGLRLPSMELNYKIKYHLDDPGIDFEGFIEDKATLKLTLNGPTVTSNIDNNDEFESGHIYNASIYIQNPNPKINFTRVIAELEFDVNTPLDKVNEILDFTSLASKGLSVLNSNNLWEAINESVYTSINKTRIFYLKAGRRLLVWKFPFKKNVAKQKIVDLKIRMNYTTEFGEQLFKEEEFKVKFEPKKQMKVTRRGSPDSLEEDKEYIYDVSIENTRNVDIGRIKVEEQLPPEFKVQGVTSTTINLEAGQKVAAYHYTIDTPKINGSKNFYINTTIQYEYAGRQHNESHDFKIKVKDLEKRKIVFSQRLDDNDNNQYQNEIIPIKYIITNNDDVALENTMLTFPIMKDIDLVGNNTYYIGQINPGESITISDKHLIKPKLHKERKTQFVTETLLSYDANGQHFTQNSSRLKLRITNSSFRTPSIILDKKLLEKEVYKNEPAIILLNVTNLQDIPTNVKIYDALGNKNIRLNALEQRILRYNITFNSTGTHNIPITRAEYSSPEKSFYTRSDLLTVKVLKMPKPVDVSKDKITPPEESTDKKTTIWQKIGNFFKKIFTWRRK